MDLFIFYKNGTYYYCKSHQEMIMVQAQVGLGEKPDKKYLLDPREFEKQKESEEKEIAEKAKETAKTMRAKTIAAEKQLEELGHTFPVYDEDGDAEGETPTKKKATKVAKKKSAKKKIIKKTNNK